MASRRTSSSASRRHAREADLARREGVSRCEASRLVPGVRSVVLAAQFESRRLPARVGPRGCSRPRSPPMSSPKDARGADAGADAALRAAVKPAVERVLREAPWTFNKTNPLKDACRAFLDAVADPGVAAPELARARDPSAHARVRLGQSRGVRARARRRARTRRARRTRRNHPNVVPGHVPIARQGARRRRRARRERRSTTGRARISRRRIGVSASSEGNRTSRADDAARRTALVVAAAKCAETNEPRVHVAVIAASLAFATSDSFRLAERRARPRRSRALTRLRRRRVPGRSRRREIGARDAHQRRLQTSRTALLRNDGRRLDLAFLPTTPFGSSRLAFGSSRRLAFGSSRLRDDELVSGLLSLFASSSPLGGVRRAPVRLGAVQIASRPVESARRGERGGVPRAFQNRRHGPSASTSRGTVRVRVVGDVSRLRARSPVRGVVARRGRGSVEAFLRSLSPAARSASAAALPRVGARGVRGAGDSRAIVV